MSDALESVVDMLSRTILERVHAARDGRRTRPPVIDLTTATDNSCESFAYLVTNCVLPRIVVELGIRPVEALVAIIDAGFGLGKTRVRVEPHRLEIEVLLGDYHSQPDDVRRLIKHLLHEFVMAEQPGSTIVKGETADRIGIVSCRTEFMT